MFVRHYARVESVRLSKFEDQRLDYQRLTENLERVRKYVSIDVGDDDDDGVMLTFKII